MHDLLANSRSTALSCRPWWKSKKSGLLTLCLISQLADAVDIRVGGEAGWTHTAQFDDVTAVVGDRLVFDWAGDQKNVVTLPKRSCDNVENGVQIAGPFDSPVAVSLNFTGTFFFSSSLNRHCAAGSLFAVSVTLKNETAEDTKKRHEEERGGSFEALIRDGVGTCVEPTQDPSDSSLFTAVCYSPAIHLKPGQIEDAFYFLPNPFPEGNIVGVVKQTLGLVDGSSRQVPLSELYLHHIFGPSNLVVGEGAEFRGGNAEPPLAEPFHTVVNGSQFVSDMSRLVNIHVINTLGVEPEDVPHCIECWCTDAEHELKGKHGGGSCCSQCPSTALNTITNTYHLQFNVTYRVLEPSTPVKPVISYMLDAANGSIEYDVVQQPDKQTALLSLSGPMDARCPQTSSFGLVRCLGHQHIGGQCMRLINQDTGEELCNSCPSYGSSDSRGTVGEESGYLVKMSQTVFDQPKLIQPGTNVTIESEYNPSENHFGVMALFFLDLVDFNTSCPGPVTATTGSAFGPDYAHHEGTAFGFYASGFGHLESGDELQSDPGDTRGIDETADPEPMPANKKSSAVFPTVVLAGSLVIVAAAGLFAWALQSRRQKYEPLSQSDLTEEISSRHRSQHSITDA
ncbi:TPA: hypothetical protein ACH3X1_006082 [Trebouxia sp. C0004]